MTTFILPLSSTLNTINTALSAAFTLFKTANIIFSMNKHVVMTLTIYASYKLIKNFVYKPLYHLAKYAYLESKPLSKLIISYNRGTVIITGATRGLGPAYCKALIEAGFIDFVLIDDSEQELIKVRENLEEYLQKSQEK